MNYTQRVHLCLFGENSAEGKFFKIRTHSKKNVVDRRNTTRLEVVGSHYQCYDNLKKNGNSISHIYFFLHFY